MTHLASDAVAHSLVGALGVRVVRSRLIRGVGPGYLVWACAIRTVSRLVKLFSVLNEHGSDQARPKIDRGNVDLHVLYFGWMGSGLHVDRFSGQNYRYGTCEFDKLSGRYYFIKLFKGRQP